MIECIVGVFMLAGGLALLFLAFKVSGLTSLSRGQGYTISAVFKNIGDLKTRAKVTLSGVKIGEVTEINLDKNLSAIVRMHIEPQYNKILADNAEASIYTAGILGSNYIAITPGFSLNPDGSGAVLKNGSVIRQTNPAIILENLISQFLFNMKSKK